MIKTGLPAALVKCLYLFVALPPRKESFVSRNDVEEEVKCSFQDTLIQVFTFFILYCESVTPQMLNLCIKMGYCFPISTSSFRRKDAKIIHFLQCMTMYTKFAYISKSSNALVSN